MGCDFALSSYPDDWDLTSLGVLLDSTGGSVQTGPFGSQLHAADYVDDGIPSVMPKNISIEGIVEKDIARITNEDAQRLSKYLLLAGDVIYSRRGDVEKCALVKPEEAGWLCGTGCLRVRLGDNSTISSEFLHAYLSSPAIREWISRNAIGATMPNLNTSILRDVPVLVPETKDIGFIAESWGLLNKKIRLNHQTNQTLEKIAQALFKSWFVDFDPVIDNALVAGKPIPDELQERAQGRQRQLAKSGHKPLPDDIRQLFPSEFELTDELGWVPKGWAIKPVEEIIDINPRVSLPKGSVAKFADMKALPTSGYSITKVIEKVYSGGAKFQNEDVLLARITPCLENGKTGIVDFLNGDDVGFGSTEFIVMRGKGAVSKPFVACLSRDANFRKHCMQSMVGSSGRQRVQNSCFDTYYLATPASEKLLVLFEEMTSSKFLSMTENKLNIEALEKLRDTLLPKLISGELRLPSGAIPDIKQQAATAVT